MSSSKILNGMVVKKSSDKTISVKVTRKVMHKKYGRYISRSKKYLVHDDSNAAVEGNEVSFKYIRPISKRKSYSLVEVKK